MKDTSGTKEELIQEISDLKKKVKKLEKSAAQHKPMEDALRASELKYRSLIEFSSDAIFCVDEKGQYQFTNSLFASTFGKTTDYFIGKTFWDIYPKEHADQRYEVTKRVFATGRSESLEVEVPQPNKNLYFYATADPIRDETGKVILNLTHAVNITERKQAEAQTKATLAALRESEASLAEAQRIARIGSWDWDMLSNTVKWSKEMYRVFGIRPEDFDGKPESLLKVIHPDDADLFTTTMKSNFKKGNPTSLEFRVIYKSGSIHHIFAAGRVEFSKDGRPIRNIGTAQDITERKQAEEALQDAHWRLESIIEGTNVGTWEWNVQTGETVFNDVWAQIIGYKLDELKPISIKTWEKYSHPDDLQQSGELLERHFAGELPYYDFDCRMKHKDGHWVWVQDRGRVITRTADGKPLLMFGTHTNITERKGAEFQREAALEALQESEFFLKTLLNSIPIPVFYKDREGRYLGFNKAFETFFGATKEKLIGKTVFDINPPDLAAIYQARDNELFESGGTQQYESQVKNTLGKMREVIFNKAIFTNSHGEISGQIGAILDISDSKQSENALKESDEKYRNLIENANEAIFVAQDGQLVFLNPMTPLLLGYSGEELVSRPFVDFVHPDDRDMVIDRHIGRLKGEAIPPFYSFRLIQKDGAVRWVELNATRIKWKGKPATLNFLSDITARKQSEAALWQSEEKFSKAFKTSPYAITITRLEDGKLIEVNDAFTSMTGFTREEVLSSSTVGLNLWVSDEDRQFVVAALSKGQAVVGKEYQFRTKKGKIITGLFSAQLIKLGTGTCILSSIDDITDRRRVEEELRETENHYRSLVEGMPGIVYTFSKKRGGLYYSPNVANILGYSPEQLYARPQLWHNSIHPDDLLLIEQVIRETATGKPYCVEYRICDAQGNWHWFEDRSFGYKLDGEDTIIEGLAFDITDRKQAKEEKSNLEAQLFQSQKMEAIGTLAGGIAHDFNNILAVIIGYTELARDRNQKQNKEQYLQETLNGAQRAKNLVKQILTFSREDGREKKPLDIKVLLKEAVKFLRASIPSTIEIDQQLTAEECNIMADPTQMHQVIMNLCTNASHAMKETGGILKIELADFELAKDEIPPHPDLQPGHYVKLTVSDTGYGIDPDNIHKIFDPFFTTKSKNEGTGLGLSVVYGIVKAHGGVINVYSERGKGAAFHIHLPRIIQTEIKEVDAGKPVIGGTERILFVDDEPSLVDIGMRMLFPLGYHVTGAASSKEALELFRAKPENFDLVITDMTLPKMTGIDLSREMLKIRPDIPIILCSGVKEHETEAQAKSLGIKAYLTKPLTRRELAGVMREVLGEKAED